MRTRTENLHAQNGPKCRMATATEATEDWRMLPRTENLLAQNAPKRLMAKQGTGLDPRRDAQTAGTPSLPGSTGGTWLTSAEAAPKSAMSNCRQGRDGRTSIWTTTRKGGQAPPSGNAGRNYRSHTGAGSGGGGGGAGHRRNTSSGTRRCWVNSSSWRRLPPLRRSFRR